MTTTQHRELSASDDVLQMLDMADSGDATAMLELGLMFLLGSAHPNDKSVTLGRDFQEAVYYLNLAAEHGDERSALYLGHSHNVGNGICNVDDPVEAFQRYQQAVDLGCDEARYYLATFLWQGRGTVQNEQLAKEIMVEGAYRGDFYCQDWLGELYECNGEYNKARTWYMVGFVFERPVEKKDVQECLAEARSRGLLVDVRHIIQRINAYRLLIDSDDPQLIELADQMRENFKLEAEF